MTFVIILRVLLSVSANAIQKRLMLDRAGVTLTWTLTYAIILLPATALALLKPIPSDGAFWRGIFFGGALDALGNLAMVAALRSTDISVFGPLNAFRPIIALGFGVIFLGEMPTAAGLCGIGITVAGAVMILSDEGKHVERTSRAVWNAVALRGLGLALGVFGAVFLKRAAIISSPEATVAAWIFFGLIVMAGATLLRRRGSLLALREEATTHRQWLLIHSGVFLAMQLLTIYIFQATLLAYAFVFFQLAMILQVFVGHFLFQEPAFRRRLIASIIMAVGSALIVWKG